MKGHRTGIARHAAWGSGTWKSLSKSFFPAPLIFFPALPIFFPALPIWNAVAMIVVKGEMTLPRKTVNSTRYARLATRGCLTRLAMFFHANAQEEFTGEEISGILIRAVQSIGSPECIGPSRQEEGAQDDRALEGTCL